MRSGPDGATRGPDQGGRGEQWASRRRLSQLVSVLVFLLPVLVSIGASTLIAHAVAAPRGGVALVGWWALMIVAPVGVYLGATRVARKALPLAALLDMTLVFPDRAPNRMAVARKAGSTRTLERELQATRARGIVDAPSVAAEHILALAASLNKHDRMTRGHAERVRVYTDLIADELKLPQEDRDRLRWAALLHDIGKLSVPPEILNKPGKPDEEEWAILQQHPLEGARLAAPLADWLGEWALAIPQHHEKYDGTGYPRGLAGEQISLGGRIVTVADSYDSMTAVRSYRRPTSPEAARRELAACAGTQFDPVIVRAFLGASVGRLHLIGGPLAWLGELGPIREVPRIGQLVAAAGQHMSTVAAAAGFSAAVAVGASHAATHPLPAVPTATPQQTATATTVPHHAAGGSPTTTRPPAGTATTTTTSTTAPTSAADGPAASATTTTTLPSRPTTAPVTAPSAPGTVQAVAGNGQVALAWTAPTSDGGAPVSAYRVTPEVAGSALPAVTYPSGATAETVTGLSNGTTYQFTVAASNGVAVGPASAASPSVTPATLPGAPDGVVATGGDGQAAVSWNPPADDGGSAVEGYEVTPVHDGTALPAQAVQGAATSVTVTGLTDGDAYTFEVAATNAVGTGPDSAPSAATLVATVPGAPTGVSAVAGDAQATVAWHVPAFDGGAPVTGYVITPYAGGRAGTPVDVGPSTTDVVGGLVDGTTYVFTVAAVNAEGAGSSSGPSNGVTPATLPGAPTHVVATGGDGTAGVSWTAPSDGGSPLLSYVVTPYDLGTAPLTSVPTGTPGTPVTVAAGATSVSVGGLTAGDEYDFTVAAVNALGTGPDATRSPPVLIGVLPPAPTAVVGVAGAGEVTLAVTMPASTGAPVTAYVVTPSTGTGSLPPVTLPASAPLVVTGLTDGTAYTFTVAAVNAVGEGPSAPPAGPYTPATVPGAPTRVAAVAGNARATVTWAAPTSTGGAPITGYQVTPVVDGTALPSTTVGPSTTSVLLTGLTDGVATTFSVAAVNAVGTGPSAGVTVDVGAPPDAPTGLTGLGGNGSLSLSWHVPADNGYPVTSYTVTVTPTAGTANGPATTVTVTGTSTTVTGLTDGETYAVTVAATNQLGTGPASAAVDLTPIALPGAPTKLAGVAGDGRVTLTWTAPSSSGGSALTGYLVTPRINGVAQAPVAFASAATTESVTGLTDGTTYTFVVAAQTAVGTGPASSATPTLTPFTGTTVAGPDAGGWTLNGTAALSSGVLDLTTAGTDQAGSAFWPTPVPAAHLTASFTTTIGGGTGADGLTLTLASPGAPATSLGAHGSGLGFSGIPGVAVGIDTYNSILAVKDERVGVTDGPSPLVPGQLDWLDVTSSVPELRATDTVMVSLTSGTLTVWVDGTQVLSTTVSVGPTVLVGFTGGTGAKTDDHDVSDVVITGAA